MPNFQGSGFQISLPDNCTDTTAYSFLLPTEGPFTPYVVVKAERLLGPRDLRDYVSQQQTSLEESVEGFEVVKYAAGKRSGMDVVLTSVEWGPLEGRISQKTAYFLLKDEKGYKIFTLTGTDLKRQFAKTGPLFEQIFKSFSPNQVQLIEA